MKNVIFKILREHLNELNIRPKGVYNVDGEDHVIYPSNNPDRLYKVGKRDVVLRWLRVFKNNPEFFPIVYKWGRSSMKEGYYFVEVEKLDVPKAKAEYSKLRDVVFKVKFNDKGISSGDFRNYMEGRYDIRLLEPEFKNNPELNEIFKRWEELSLNIVPLIGQYKDYPDLHGNNFGYDKNGNLKCLDI